MQCRVRSAALRARGVFGLRPAPASRHRPAELKWGELTGLPFPGIVWPSLSCSLQLRSPVGATGKGMRIVGGSCTEGEAVMPVCVDLG